MSPDTATEQSSPATPAIPHRQIRASYDESTITVYQAYSSTIADPALATQKLSASSDWLPERMTWIKPSWCWMMYRSGYSYKDERQERILAIRMKHEDFLGVLRQATVNKGAGDKERATGGRARDEGSWKDKRLRGKKLASKVQVQWDPERSPKIGRLSYRSIQIGLRGAIRDEWVEKWIVGIEDVTERARDLKKVLDEDSNVTMEELVKRGLVPEEKVFEVPEDVREILGMDFNGDSTVRGEENYNP